MIAPTYSVACQHSITALLKRGGSLSGYRSNPKFPVGPISGSWAWQLERLAERMFGGRAVACSSGTMALWAAIRSAGLPPWPRGEIITTAFTFSATPAAILWAGYAPVFADVTEEGLIDPASVQRMRSSRTVAIVPVDLFGRLCNYPDLERVGLPIIEDACQAVGARRNGTWAGFFGIAGAYSFNGAKNVPAGEAGMLVTRSRELERNARLFLSHGENFGAEQVGLNGRINELTACLAYYGLRRVLRMNQKRRQRVWNRFRQRIGPDHAAYAYPYPGSLKNRAALVRNLRREGFSVSEGYLRPPLHRYRAFAQYRRDALPVTEWLSSSGLLLVTKAPEDTL